MSGYNFFRSLQMIGMLGMIVLGAIFCFVRFIWSELSREANYRSKIGPGWEAEYERVFGSLSKAHNRIAVSVFGIVAICLLVVWLYRSLRPARAHEKRHRHDRSRKQYGSSSHLERTIRCRRNALLGVYFGLPAILVGVALVVLRIGIFADHADEVVLGIGIFICGYFCVVSGCWWWLKAKEWSEAIVFIAFMPLTILLVPFVRLLILSTPLLPVAMAMAPLILVVVVFVLPDKSSFSKRKRWPGRRFSPADSESLKR
jgi:Ca2+/Na+ antiporter